MEQKKSTWKMTSNLIPPRTLTFMDVRIDLLNRRSSERSTQSCFPDALGGFLSFPPLRFLNFRDPAHLRSRHWQVWEGICRGTHRRDLEGSNLAKSAGAPLQVALWIPFLTRPGTRARQYEGPAFANTHFLSCKFSTCKFPPAIFVSFPFRLRTERVLLLAFGNWRQFDGHGASRRIASRHVPTTLYCRGNECIATLYHGNVIVWRPDPSGDWCRWTWEGRMKGTLLGR